MSYTSIIATWRPETTFVPFSTQSVLVWGTERTMTVGTYALPKHGVLTVGAVGRDATRLQEGLNMSVQTGEIVDL